MRLDGRIVPGPAGPRSRWRNRAANPGEQVFKLGVFSETRGNRTARRAVEPAREGENVRRRVMRQRFVRRDGGSGRSQPRRRLRGGG